MWAYKCVRFSSKRKLALLCVICTPNPDLEHSMLIKSEMGIFPKRAGEMLILILLKVIKTHFISPDMCHKRL